MASPSKRTVAGVRALEPQHQPARGRLARAGLADEAERFALADLEADTSSTARHRVQRAEQAAPRSSRCADSSCLERAARSFGGLHPAATRSTSLRPDAGARRSSGDTASRAAAAAARHAARRRAGSAARRRSRRGIVARIGHGAGDRGQPPARAVERRQRADQARAYRDGTGRRTASIAGASSTMRPAYITATRSQCLGDDAEIVADQHHRHAASRGAIRAISSRICAWMVASSAVVGSSAISRSGFAGQRHGDHDALVLPAGEFVRIGRQPPLGVGNADQIEQPPAPRAATALPRQAAMQRQRLAELAPDRQHRIERARGVLEDHRDAAAAHAVRARRRGAPRMFGAVERHTCRRPSRASRQQAERGKPGHRLAGAGLADQAERLALARRRDRCRAAPARRRRLTRQVLDS